MPDTATAAPRESHRRWPVWVALSAILLVAVLLRVHGLWWGLRHAPDPDEAVFVESARAMIRAGDLDHRFYEYPGLLLYILAPVVACFPSRGPLDPAAYMAVRAFAVAFSVLSVGLVFLLARRLAGVAAGLLAAALMAVAPLEVWTTHMLRSDVVLEAFVLASLLWFQRIGERARTDAWCGVAIGATAAIKFTGVLIAPAYFAARCVRPGPRWRGLALAAGVSILVWFAATPYALLKPTAYFAGASNQAAYFYGAGGFATHFVAFADFYVRAVVKGMGGVVAAACALLGFIVARRSWRAWLPLVVYAAVLIAALSTAEIRLSRLALSCVGPCVAIAGIGLAALVERWRVLGSVLAALVLALPLWRSVEVGQQFARPSTMDRALDWFEGHVPRGARILSAVPQLGLDPARYEIVYATRLGEGDRAWADGVDWVVVAGQAPPSWYGRDLRVAAAFDPTQRTEGVRIEVLAPPPASWQRVAVQATWLSASVSQDQLPALADGDLRTAWRTPGPQQAGTWIEISFPQPQRVERIELVPGRRQQFARTLDLFVREGRGVWARLPSYAGRPHLRDQPPGGQTRSQVALVSAPRATGLRLVLRRSARQPWSVAELWIAARDTRARAASDAAAVVSR